MIISSAPLRISFNGGGSDLPAYCEDYTGHTVSATLNKRVYIAVSRSFSGSYRLSYSKTEVATSVKEITHPIIREVLVYLEYKGFPLEITSMADIPSNGTGLGSSSAFTVALIRSIAQLQGRTLSSSEVAQIACHIEIERLGELIGRQDQYISSFGGLKSISYHSEGITKVRNVFRYKKEAANFVYNFNSSARYFFVASGRSSGAILANQSQSLKSKSKLELTHSLKALSEQSLSAIRSNDIKLLGELMLSGWEKKCELNGDIDNPKIQKLLDLVRESDLYGGKLMGAGGGGFIVVLGSKESLSTFEKRVRGSAIPENLTLRLARPKLHLLT